MAESISQEEMEALRSAEPSFLKDGLGIRGPVPAQEVSIDGPGVSGEGSDWSIAAPQMDDVPADIDGDGGGFTGQVCVDGVLYWAWVEGALGEPVEE